MIIPHRSGRDMRMAFDTLHIRLLLVGSGYFFSGIQALRALNQGLGTQAEFSRSSISSNPSLARQLDISDLK